VKLVFKNNSTLTFEPTVQNGEVTEYQMDYLTSKEIKQIENTQKKIKALEEQIQTIKKSGLCQTTKEEDDEGNNEEKEEESVDTDTDTDTEVEV